MIITLAQLKKYLEPHADDKETLATQSYEENGPGRINRWLYLEGESKCRLHRKSGNIEQQKKQIIISNGLLAEHYPSQAELSLVSALIEYYSVYFWPGEGRKFTECKPLESSAEFWQTRDTCCGATKYDVENNLALQSLATEDYIVLDYTGYHSLLGKFSSPYPNAFSPKKTKASLLTLQEKISRGDEEKKDISFPLSLQEISQGNVFERLQASVDLHTIKVIRSHSVLFSSQEMHILLQLPALTTIIIRKASIPESLVNDEIQKLLANKIGIKLQKCWFENIFVIPSILDHLDIYDAENLKKLIIEPGKDSDDISISRLTLKECPRLETIELPRCPALTRLAINSCDKLTEIDFNFLPALEYLEIAQAYSLNLKSLNTCSQLSYLKISDVFQNDSEFYTSLLPSLSRLKKVMLNYNNNIEQFDPCIYKELEEIKIEYGPENPHHQIKGDINYVPKLKKLLLDSSKADDLDVSTLSATIIQSATLKNLRLIMHDNMFQFNLNTCPNLSLLSLEEHYNLKEINISSTTNLHALRLKNCAKLTTLNIDNASNITSLVIDETYHQLSSALPNLEKLNLTISPANSELAIGNKFPALKRLVVNLDKEIILKVDLSSLHHLEKLSILKNNSKTHKTRVYLINTAACKNLKKIDIRHFAGCEYDFAQLPNLEELILRDFSGTTLNLSHLNKLKHFKMIGYEQPIHSLTLSNLPCLEEVTLGHLHHLSKLNLNSTPNIKRFNIVGGCNKIATLVIPSKKLEVLEISQGHSTSIDFSFFRNSIKWLNLGEFTKSMLTSPFNFPNLEFLNIYHFEPGKDAGELNLTGCPQLKKVILSSSFKFIDLSGLRFLKKLKVIGGAIHLNLHHCDSLINCKINIGINSNIAYLKELKNLRLLRSESSRSFNESLPGQLPIHCELQIPPSEAQRIAAEQMGKPISFISENLFRDDYRLMDSHTEGAKTYIAPNNFKVTIESKQPVKRDYLRAKIYNGIKINQSGQAAFISTHTREPLAPAFIPEVTDTQIKSFLKMMKKNPDYKSGFIEVDCHASTYYPLIAEKQMLRDQIVLSCSPHDAVEFVWNHNFHLFEFTLKANVPDQRVKVLYLYQESPNYHLHHRPSSTQVIVQCNPYYLLQEQLISTLTEALQAYPPLSFLFSPFLPTSEKIQKLIAFIQAFKPGSVALSTNTIDAFFASIFQKKGVCRHRAQDFMLLAHFIGVPVVMTYSEEHAYCVMPYYDTEKREESWHLIELGGGDRQNLTPANRYNNIFENFKFKQKKQAQHTILPLVTHHQQEQLYYNGFRRFTKEEEVSSIQPLLNDKLPFAPIITLKAQQSPLDVNRQFILQLNALGINTQENYLYIHDVKALLQYLEPYCLINGRRKQMPGPLARLIKQGGIILINWSAFNPNEIAIYKTILDEIPTLLGKPLVNVKVIGLKTKDTVSCSAFNSRCLPFSLHHDFFTATNETHQENLPPPIAVDLFNNICWQEKFFGDLQFHDYQQIALIPGPIFAAIQERRPLLFYNPPKDDTFHRLIRQIQDERRLLHNDEFVAVPPEVVIKTASLEHANTLDNVHVITSTFITKQQPIHLGLHNFHLCFETLIIDENEQPDFNPQGLLHEYDADKHYFYVTESIPSSDWQELLVFIKTHYPSKSFQFVLAPQVEIEKVAMSKALPIESENIFVSNDSDFCCLELTEALRQMGRREPLIIDVNTATCFSDLIDSHPTTFSYQKQRVLKALEKGRDVILNGELNPELCKELMPLLSSSPYIYSNGKRIDVAGILLMVQPRFPLSLLKPRERHYSFPHYAAAFTDNKDKLALELLQQFYFFAALLPHQSKGRPNSPLLSFQRLQRMVHALKERRLHPSNPIKGLFHYDYPVDSEDYAYLNVVAKYLFSPTQDMPPRLYKLKKLIATYGINTIDDLKKHIWKILNCWNGKDLRQMLGDRLHAVLLPHAAFPTLDINQAFMQALLSFLLYMPDEYVKSTSHVEKREQQLDTLLHDENIPFIQLKGEAGAGKTFSVRRLEKKLGFRVYEGEEAIFAWAKERGDGLIILLLNETNIAHEGKWNFFKGRTRPKSDGTFTVFTATGKKINLTSRHRIVSTINPEIYTERHYHAFWQNFGEILYFAELDADFLEKMILNEKFKNTGFHHPFYTKRLLKAYYLIQEMNPLFIYSIRDLESLTCRFLALANHTRSEEDVLSILWRACIGEFAGTLSGHEKRQLFGKTLAEKFGAAELAEKNNLSLFLDITSSFSITAQKAFFVEAILQDLKIRDYYLKHPDAMPNYKLGVLLQGDAGIGKSTLIRMILEAYGFSKHAEDKQKFYSEISAGNEEADTENYKQACEGGYVTIWDELNLNQNIEKLLTDSPTNLKNSFMFFASQNPNTSQYNVNSLSPALFNRVHFLRMEDFSYNELLAIAKRHHITYPNEFVNAFIKAKNDYPDIINMRTFYALLKEQPTSLKRSRPPEKKEKEKEKGSEEKIFKRHRH